MRRGPGIAFGAAVFAATVALVVGGVHALMPASPVCAEQPAEPVVTPPAPVAAPPPPVDFDVLACVLDERLGPPPAATSIRLHSQRELAAAAREIAHALPAAWHAHVELDATGMAKLVELHIAGARAPSASAKLLLDLVRAHPCLFGVVAPAELTAVGDGDLEHQGVGFYVRSPNLGNLYASLDSEGHAYHVVFETHLWPIVDRAPAIDPARMLARYVGHTYGAHSGWRMLAGTREHHGPCVAIVSDRVAGLSKFRWHAGPILACRGDHADVVYGARVDLSGAMRRDGVLAELPTALLPDGTPVAAPRIAPAAPDVEGVDFLHDLGECPPSP